MPSKVVYSWAERAWTLPTVVSLCGLHGAIAVAAEFDDMPEVRAGHMLKPPPESKRSAALSSRN